MTYWWQYYLLDFLLGYQKHTLKPCETFPWVTWPIYCHLYKHGVFGASYRGSTARTFRDKNSLKSWHEPSPSVCHHISLRASQLLCPSPRQWPTKRGHILPSGTLPFYVAGPGIMLIACQTLICFIRNQQFGCVRLATPQDGRTVGPQNLTSTLQGTSS